MGKQKIGFIGAGHIAESMIRGIIRSGFVDPGQIVISDTNQKRLIHVHETLGATIAWSNADNAAQVGVLFLAVKPAQVAAVAKEIVQALDDDTFVISVAAGTSLASIRREVGDRKRLCRIMPNLAATVRRSTIGLYADAEMTSESLGPVYETLTNIGKVYRIEDEALMAVITALSGSAPAYYVMMAAALVKFGISHGLPAELAETMILGTMEGSAAWALDAETGLDALWRKVVTPGGTTEAGVNHYEEQGFLDIFVEGLERSTRRAQELDTPQG